MVSSLAILPSFPAWELHGRAPSAGCSDFPTQKLRGRASSTGAPTFLPGNSSVASRPPVVRLPCPGKSSKLAHGVMLSQGTLETYETTASRSGRWRRWGPTGGLADWEWRTGGLADWLAVTGGLTD